MYCLPKPNRSSSQVGLDLEDNLREKDIENLIPKITMTTNFTPLVEEASQEDLFEHKTHENVANAIKKLLVNNKGKGQTIGVEGDWGSGKSTVISLLKSKLPESDFEYFYFDAWAHEGDPLRRVFLESLIDVIGGENLADLKERISNRKKTVKSKYSRQVTALGKWLSLSLFFVPLGAAIVSTIDITKVSLNFIYGFNWRFIIGTILAIAPLLVALVNLVKIKIEKGMWNDPENWSFLVSEGQSETTQEISEDEERSSIEFEGYFDEILSLSFEKNKEKQLLMVIDNLDRIDAEVSLRIWSTLQTFLKQRNPDSKKQYHAGNIWIIVPYDLDGLSKLWTNGTIGCAQSFFDKCFQLRFEVPRPVFTDWEEFCREMIEKAFGKKFGGVQSVINVLKLTRDDLKDIPTPREIKTYINQLGVVLLANEDKKPIDSLAYYAIQRFIKRVTVKELQEGLISGDIPQDYHLANLPDTIIKDLAGLSFGVSSKIGQQLLLEPEIEDALEKGDQRYLKNLVEIHRDGFWFVFNHHLRSSNGKLFQYTSVIKESIGDEDSHKLRSFVNTLKKSKIQFEGHNVLENHLAFLSFLSPENYSFKDYWKKLVSHLQNQFGDLNFDVDRYVEFINKANPLIKEKDKTVYTISQLNVDNWIKWFKYSKQYDWIKWFLPDESLSSELAKKIPQNSDLPDDLDIVVEGLAKVGHKQWGDFVLALKNHIIWNNGTPSGQSHSIDALKVIYKLSCLDNEDVNGQLIEILHNSAFYNYVYNRRDRDSSFYASILLAKYYTGDLHSLNLSAVGNSATGMQQLRAFWNTRNESNAKRIHDELISTDSRLLWNLIGDERNKLMIDVLKNILSSEGRFFEGDDAYNRYLKVFKLTKNDDDVEMSEIAKRFVSETNIVTEINNLDEINIIKNCEELYYLIPFMNDAQVIYDSVKQLNKNDWDEAIREDTYLLEMIVDLNKRDGIRLDKAYYESILEFVNNWFDGKLKPSEWQLSKWTILGFLLDQAFLAQFKSNVTKLVEDNLRNCAAAFFEANKEFIDVKRIAQAKNVEIQLLIENMLRDQIDTDQLHFVVSLLEVHRPKFDKEFGKVVKEDIFRHCSNSENSIKEGLMKIAGYLKIEVSDSKSELKL